MPTNTSACDEYDIEIGTCGENDEINVELQGDTLVIQVSADPEIDGDGDIIEHNYRDLIRVNCVTGQVALFFVSGIVYSDSIKIINRFFMLVKCNRYFVYYRDDIVYLNDRINAAFMAIPLTSPTTIRLPTRCVVELLHKSDIGFNNIRNNFYESNPFAYVSPP